jgi:hypothetical protein
MQIAALLADPVQPVAKTHRGRRLALARRRRVDRGHQDQLALGPTAKPLDEIGADLGLVMAEGQQRLGRDAQLRANLLDRLLLRGARDFDIGFRCHWCLPPWFRPA